MGFTYDREDYTAAELNTVWSNTVSSIAGILPPDIRILESGLRFDDLVPIEGKYTRRVNGPRDVLKAVTHFAGLSGFPGNWKAISTGGTQMDEAFLSIKNKFIPQNENYNFDQAILKAPSRGIDYAQAYLRDPDLFESNIDPTVDNKIFEIQKNREGDLKVANFGEFSLTGITSSSAVGITTIFSVTGLTYSSTKQISNSSLGWFDDSYTNLEKFSSETGFDQWFLGVGTTVTQEANWFGTGFLQWNFGTAYMLGAVEKFSDANWPEGVSPSPSGGSSNQIAENITSQINGVTNTFSTGEQYISGSLRVYYNGQRMVKDVTFTELTSTTFRLTFVPTSGDVLNVDYNPAF